MSNKEQVFEGGGRTKSYFMAQLPTMAKIKAKEIWDMYLGEATPFDPSRLQRTRMCCYFHIGGIEMEYGQLHVNGHISAAMRDYNMIFWQDVKREIDQIFNNS